MAHINFKLEFLHGLKINVGIRELLCSLVMGLFNVMVSLLDMAHMITQENVVFLII